MLLRISYLLTALATTSAFVVSPQSHERTNQRIHPSTISQIRNSKISDNNIFLEAPRSQKAASTPQISTCTSTSLYSTKSNESKQGMGITSTLISQLAIVALKLRLATQSGVSCQVNASSRSLLLSSTPSIGPVTVRGKNWGSPLGLLTCRAIEAQVETCKLDMNSVVKRRKLVLTQPAVGKAMVALDGVDFGNFLTHPLLLGQSPTLSTSSGHCYNTNTNTDENNNTDEAEIGHSNGKQFEFKKEGIEIQHETGTVIFYGTCMGENWRCDLTRNNSGNNKAIVTVSHMMMNEKSDSGSKSTSTSTPSSASASELLDIDAISMELSMVMSQFFNNIVFELDGTFLTFQDFKIHNKRKSDDDGTALPTLLMALGITVKKFPSPGLEF